MTKSWIFAAATVALMAPVAANAAVTFDTQTYNTAKSTCYTSAGATYSCNGNLSGTAGNSLIVKGSDDTLQVKVTAWQANQSSNAITSAYLGTYSGGGLGVTGAGDTSGGTAGGGGTHQIDNVGGYTDFVMLQFSRAVRLDQISTKLYTLNGVSPMDSDASWFNGDGVIIPSPAWNSYVNLAGYTNSPSLWTNADGGSTDSTRNMGVPSNMFSSIWLISAAQLPISDLDDGFKLSQLIVTPKVAVTPEPGTWAMMIFGFGGIGATLRRRARRPAGGTVLA